MTKCVSAKRIQVADLERVFESGRHHSGYADIKVLDFFLEGLIRGNLDDDAVVAYGMHLEQSDVRYIVPWVEAMHAVVQRNPGILTKIRLRPNLNYNRMVSDARETSLALTWLKRRVAEDLRERLAPESPCTNSRLNDLIRQLDRVS